MAFDFQPGSGRTGWTVSTERPAPWHDWIVAFDGGFFHSPPALKAGAPAGEPIYCTHRGADGVDAIALGVRHACWLSRQARHVYFPSVPAVRQPDGAQAIMQELPNDLRKSGAAQVVMDSFDARWEPRFPSANWGPSREEFTIALDGAAEDMLSRCAQNHRRNIRKGDRSGWEMRNHVGAEAHEVMALVVTSARARAADRGAPFHVPPVQSIADTLAPSSIPWGVPSSRPWGVTVFAAWDSQEILGAVIAGWAGRRGYYVAGGSTPAGYSAGVGAWLQWHVAQTFATAGMIAYNLGGGPRTSAEDRGLRRFKSGFGAAVSDCRGGSWRLRPLHARSHRAHRLLTGWLRA